MVCDSRLLLSIREFLNQKNEKLGYLLRCHQCCGFWIGILLHFLSSFFNIECNHLIVDALIVSGVSQVLSRL